eukprot:4733324-Amphidinium_carterae.1
MGCRSREVVLELGEKLKGFVELGVDKVPDRQLLQPHLLGALRRGWTPVNSVCPIILPELPT